MNTPESWRPQADGNKQTIGRHESIVLRYECNVDPAAVISESLHNKKPTFICRKWDDQYSKYSCTKFKPVCADGATTAGVWQAVERRDSADITVHEMDFKP